MRFALVMAFVLASGCSFLVGATGGYRIPDGPRDLPPDADLPCTNAVTPSIDGLVGGLNLLVTGGAYVADLASKPGEFRGLLSAIASITTLPVGLLYIGSAIYGSKRNDRCRAAYTRTQPPRKARQLSHEDAVQFATEAATAAKSGDCSTAISVAEPLCELARDVHDTMFAADAAIARCLAEHPPSERYRACAGR